MCLVQGKSGMIEDVHGGHVVGVIYLCCLCHSIPPFIIVESGSGGLNLFVSGLLVPEGRIVRSMFVACFVGSPLGASPLVLSPEWIPSVSLVPELDQEDIGVDFIAIESSFLSACVVPGGVIGMGKSGGSGGRSLGSN
ncbi:hypothetical protein AAC387_Pa05g1276 [Persea americana]